MAYQAPYDPLVIVDVYNRLAIAKRNNYEVDNTREAEALSSMMRVLGPTPRQLAITPEEQPDVQVSYTRAGFQSVPMNGNRPEALMTFMTQEMNSLYVTKPQNMVLVTGDPAFAMLATQAARLDTKVQIWSPGSIPPQLTSPDFNNRQLEDLIRGTIIKVTKAVVYLDYENLHIGLEQRGIKPIPRTVIEAVRTSVADLGSLLSIEAFADWGELSKGGAQNIQRELEVLGVKTHYQISRHGKNSADMALANEIRTRLGRQDGDPDAADLFVLGSRDRDFSTIIREAQKTKRVVVLGLTGDTSNDLEKLAEVRYLDERMPQQESNKSKSLAKDPEFALLMQIATYMNERKYKWVYQNRLAQEIDGKVDTAKSLKNVIDAGFLKPWQDGDPNKLMLNLEQPDAYIAHWLVNRIDYSLNRRKMPYVDTNYLANGMRDDRNLQEFGLYQTRAEAQKVLDRGAKTGCIVKESRENPKSPGKTVIAWRLANSTDDAPSPTPNSHPREEKIAAPAKKEMPPSDALPEATVTPKMAMSFA